MRKFKSLINKLNQISNNYKNSKNMLKPQTFYTSTPYRKFLLDWANHGGTVDKRFSYNKERIFFSKMVVYGKKGYHRVQSIILSPRNDCYLCYDDGEFIPYLKRKYYLNDDAILALFKLAYHHVAFSSGLNTTMMFVSILRKQKNKQKQIKKTGTSNIKINYYRAFWQWRFQEDGKLRHSLHIFDSRIDKPSSSQPIEWMVSLPIHRIMAVIDTKNAFPVLMQKWLDLKFWMLQIIIKVRASGR